MFGRKKQPIMTPAAEEKQGTPTPAYLREDYPYQAIGQPITDLDSLIPTGVLYEIKCPKCEMSLRSQGLNIKPSYLRMMQGEQVTDENGIVRTEGGKGCIGCGNRELIIRQVDTSKMAAVKAATKS